MGRNGSGKSSLLWALQGTGQRQGGEVSVEGTRSRRSCRAAWRARWSGWCRRRRAICCTSSPSTASVLPPTSRRRPPQAPLARCWTGWHRASTVTSIRVTSPRDSGWRWCWRCSCRRLRRSCCSTSRPAGWTMRPKQPWRG
ncbi:ATP-binding cassette domain-containing protein [Aeromicrobium sp. UC242_57]|uniref:ATP-binding cassette domain-containing protein n=1 Tax=Aeromicrobium sp. UC242_57 TaxID=3374624 RepID=UPI003796B6A2